MLVVVGLGAAFVSNSVARDQALQDSDRVTQRLSRLVVAPLLPDYLARKPAGMAELERTIRNRMSDRYLTEVTVWTADGTVAFSNKAEDIGKRFAPSPQVVAALHGTTTSDFEDDAPEADASPGAPTTAPSEDEVGPSRFVEV